MAMRTLNITRFGTDRIETDDSIGPNYIHGATIELTNAQIIALPTTPVVIVPATSGILDYSGMTPTLPVPVLATIDMDTSAGAYTNVAEDSHIAFAWGSDKSVEACGSRQETDGILVNADRKLSVLPATAATAGYLVFENLYDNAIVVFMNNVAAGVLTAGHADNTMRVSLLYYVLNTTTGAFVAVDE